MRPQQCNGPSKAYYIRPRTHTSLYGPALKGMSGCVNQVSMVIQYNSFQFPWENSWLLTFCLKTHKSALFVWTGVSSRVVLSIYSPSLHSSLCLFDSDSLTGLLQEWDEWDVDLWWFINHIFQTEIYTKRIDFKVGPKFWWGGNERWREKPLHQKCTKSPSV